MKTILAFLVLCSCLRAEPDKIFIVSSEGIGSIQAMLNDGWIVRSVAGSREGCECASPRWLFVLVPPEDLAEREARKQAAAVEAARLRREQWVKDHPVEKSK